MENREIIQRLNDLFTEALINAPEEELLQYSHDNPDPGFERNLQYIRKLNTKAKAKMSRNIWTTVQEVIQKLIKEVGKNKVLDDMLSQPQYKEVAAFFSKYQGADENDKESMLMEQKVLDLIKNLKEEIKSEEDSN